MVNIEHALVCAGSNEVADIVVGEGAAGLAAMIAKTGIVECVHRSRCLFR